METREDHFTVADGGDVPLRLCYATRADLGYRQADKVRWDRSGTVEGRDVSYRYVLERHWGALGEVQRPVLFVCLNPSTAGVTEDDPTLRRCIAFAQAWRNSNDLPYTGVLLLNLYARRGTDPSVLEKVDQARRYSGEPPLHEDLPERPNSYYLCQAVGRCALCVAAWGSQPWATGQAQRVRDLLQRNLKARGMKLHHLGLNGDGSPKHPLYLPKTTLPQPWLGEEDTTQ